MKKRRISHARRNIRLIFLLAFIVIIGGIVAIQKGATTNALTHNLIKYPKSKMTRLTLKKVFSAKRPSGMGSLQGFTMTDKYYVMILRPPGQDDNNRVEVVRRSDNKVVTSSFGNPVYNLGHGNDATWNTKTNEIAVVDGARKVVFLMSATNFKKTGTTKFYNSEGLAYGPSGIAYDKERNIYYTSGGGYFRTFDTNNHLVSGFNAKYNQTNQGYAYNNGYLYLPTWESAGTYNNATYDGIFKKNTTVLYQFGRDGSFTHAYYIDNPLYEVESMAFDEKGIPYLAFNGPSGYYTVYKITDANLLKQLRQRYTITYFGNGGSGLPGEQTAYVGVEKILSKTKPTRSGYSFLGWSTSKTATKASYTAGAQFIKPYGTSNANVKLYAVWKKNPYTITYNANGGTGAPSSQSVAGDQNATISSAKPTRSGYSFLGWSTSKTATKADYQPGATYSAKKTITLYAVWKANAYTLTYNANGGQGAPASQTATAGQSITISSAKPTRSGYSFLGWATSQDATKSQYAPGSKYTGSTNVTLYAVWQKNTPVDPQPTIQTITITYDANGGQNAPAATTGEVGKVVISAARPNRSGYVFLGWSADRSATTAGYQPGAAYNGTVSITLYAVWLQIITVSYDANGGQNTPASQEAKYGQELTLATSRPTRDGYTFLGWNMDKGAKDSIYAPGTKVTFTSNVTLYAVWENNTFIVRFDPNGGTSCPAPVSVSDGEIVIPQDILYRDGYIFLGWNTDKNAQEAKYLPGDIVKDDIKNSTLYAIWRKIEKDPGSEDTTTPVEEDKDENINDASEENGGEEDDTVIPTEVEDADELPNTGPADVVVASIAFVCLGGGLCYWLMSQKQLKNLQKTARGKK